MNAANPFTLDDQNHTNVMATPLFGTNNVGQTQEVPQFGAFTGNETQSSQSEDKLAQRHFERIDLDNDDSFSAQGYQMTAKEQRKQVASSSTKGESSEHNGCPFPTVDDAKSDTSAGLIQQ
mmetsp:Transcript_39160/g.37508  ORF Transcript_39160/g.37508 Transcript_39160/m.37508 type:complete len:121 (-) Transcript_39160:85-447(-)